MVVSCNCFFACDRTLNVIVIYMSFNSVQDSFLLDDQVLRRDIIMKAASGMYLDRVHRAE